MKLAIPISICVIGAVFLGCRPVSTSGTAGQTNDSQRVEIKQVGYLLNPADEEKKQAADQGKEKKMEKATFGNGCFWCTEAVFQRLKGVEKVTSGYTNGSVEDPTYKQVCSGSTGHAEAIEIEFDPAVISFEELLEVFWKTHDPTTLNRQGADTGTQYRSAVFFHNEKQKELAEFYKKKLNDAKVFNKPIVTEITAAAKFYPAEDYHQEYFNLNPRNGYCRAVIVPKIKKLEETFKDKLKVTQEK